MVCKCVFFAKKISFLLYKNVETCRGLVHFAATSHTQIFYLSALVSLEAARPHLRILATHGAARIFDGAHQISSLVLIYIMVFLLIGLFVIYYSKVFAYVLLVQVQARNFLLSSFYKRFPFFFLSLQVKNSCETKTLIGKRWRTKCFCNCYPAKGCNYKHEGCLVIANVINKYFKYAKCEKLIIIPQQYSTIFLYIVSL